MIEYKVVSRIWHTKEQRYCEPGESVDLSHLDGMGLASLLEAGVVVPVTPVADKKKKPAAPAEEGE